MRQKHVFGLLNLFKCTVFTNGNIVENWSPCWDVLIPYVSLHSSCAVGLLKCFHSNVLRFPSNLIKPQNVAWMQTTIQMWRALQTRYQLMFPHFFHTTPHFFTTGFLSAPSSLDLYVQHPKCSNDISSGSIHWKVHWQLWTSSRWPWAGPHFTRKRTKTHVFKSTRIHPFGMDQDPDQLSPMLKWSWLSLKSAFVLSKQCPKLFMYELSFSFFWYFGKMEFPVCLATYCL